MLLLAAAHAEADSFVLEPPTAANTMKVVLDMAIVAIAVSGHLPQNNSACLQSKCTVNAKSTQFCKGCLC